MTPDIPGVTCSYCGRRFVNYSYVPYHEISALSFGDSPGRLIPYAVRCPGSHMSKEEARIAARKMLEQSGDDNDT